MAAVRLFLQLVLAFVLSANHKSRAEILRRLEKPALQILSMYETVSSFTGVFNGPADTEFDGEYDLDPSTFKVQKAGENYVLTAHYKEEIDRIASVLIMKSNSTKESVRVIIPSESKSSTQTTFPLNDCQIGIEKSEHGTQTKYKARVKNCVYGRNFNIDLKQPGSVNIQYNPQNSKYVKRYTSDDKETYYIILNNRALKDDGVTITDFSFYITTSMQTPRDDIAAASMWSYDLNTNDHRKDFSAQKLFQFLVY